MALNENLPTFRIDSSLVVQFNNSFENKGKDKDCRNLVNSTQACDLLIIKIVQSVPLKFPVVIHNFVNV